MKRTATTYDEITRGTVPEPDGSFRAGADQRVERVLSSDEQRLHARVAATIHEIPGAPTEVSVEIDHETVTLRGRVLDAAVLAAIEDAVHQLDGVGAVRNELVAGS